MRLNKNTNNNIASFGYSKMNPYSFMTVHMNSKGIYGPKEVPGKIEYQSSLGETLVKKIDNDPNDPFVSLSIYRADLPSGRTHVVTGMIDNVFVPVNYTVGGICPREFMFFFDETDKDSDHLHVFVNRVDFITDKGCIINTLNLLHSLKEGHDQENEYLVRYEMELPTVKMSIWIPGNRKLAISPFSNMGRRIISCASAYLKRDLAKGLSIVDVSEAKCINAKWKVLNIGNKWYRWIYINNSVIATEEFAPDWFTDSEGREKFIASEVNNFGDIICTLFAKQGRSKDVRIPKYLHVNNAAFNLKEEVLRLAPTSSFIIESGRQGIRR